MIYSSPATDSAAPTAVAQVILPPNSIYTWLVLLSFNVPILMMLTAVPFGHRLDQALKEKSTDGLGMTSYSRVTGVLGAVILVAFFWAIGNLVLMDALGNRPNIGQLLDAVSRFFLVGSALFLPYGFNQLKSIFPWAAGTNAALIPGVGTAGDISSTAPLRLLIANMSLLSDAEVQAAVRGIQLQVTQDFASEWRAPATLSYQRLDPRTTSPPAGTSLDAIIYIGDKVDDPHAGVDRIAGYHTQTEGEKPSGFVYLDICREYRAEWTVQLSHEVLELLADPAAVLKVDGPHPRAPDATVQYALEVCDAVQTDTYPSGGVNVCNFVTRAFFDRAGGAAKLNHLGRPQTPFRPRPGGYLTWFDDAGGHNLWPDATPAPQAAARLWHLDAKRNGRRFRRLAPDQVPLPDIPPPEQPVAKLFGALRKKKFGRRDESGESR